MTPNEISRSSLLDLLFEHRNKQYGAYELRKFYGNRMALAIGIMLATVLLGLFLLNVLAGRPERIFLPPDDGVVIQLARDPLAPEEPKQPEPLKRPAAAQQVASTQFTSRIELTPDQTNVAPQQALAQTAIATTTVAGPTPGPGIQTPPDPGPGPAVQAAPAPDPAPEVEAPSAPPSFPGGMKAWTDFLVRNLIPSSDMQPGEKRSVLVRFWVDESGNVGRFEVVQSGGTAFDNEVLRVLKRMPKWKPALQKGRAVATSFVQPVTFQAPEE